MGDVGFTLWDISTHALREEGDETYGLDGYGVLQFLPTPSARRATSTLQRTSASWTFLPTPSARRATASAEGGRYAGAMISTHALREEGDTTTIPAAPASTYFYPRPPRGGRPRSRRTSSSAPGYFYPRPPRGGRRTGPR